MTNMRIVYFLDWKSSLYFEVWQGCNTEDNILFGLWQAELFRLVKFSAPLNTQ